MSITTALQNHIDASRIREHEPMSRHTTFRAGGSAQVYVAVHNAAELAEGIACCRQAGVAYYILGNGSNVLVSDKGLPGVTFQLEDSGQAPVCISDTCVKVPAGMLLSRFGSLCCQNGLTGAEWAAGIPGTVGGGVYMNAGAYGGEMKDILKEVTVLTRELRLETRSSAQLDLRYRHSALMEDDSIIVDATFALSRGESEAIKRQMEELAARRREKQPLEFPSAGSTFKRPDGYFAGKLIQDCGLRGYRVGGAQVSEKHCGFVVNTGGASAQDIYRLTEYISEEVYRRFGVKLEREVRLLGEFE
jgi:UDP-N-acetylmuramate dehydrogenase